MALNKKLQNPKRSSQDPTELNARLDKIEARLVVIEKELEDSKKVIRMEVVADRRDWVGGA